VSKSVNITNTVEITLEQRYSKVSIVNENMPQSF